MTGRHVLHRYLISKSGTPPKYRQVTPTGYLPTIGLLTSRPPIPTINNALSANILPMNLSPAGDCFDVYFAESICSNPPAGQDFSRVIMMCPEMYKINFDIHLGGHIK